MPAQDTSKIKERIISIINLKGPSIPATIASEIQTSILFTSAFLSELLSEKKLQTSHMRYGSSPIYYIAGQESKLENFSQHLKSKEKDAFHLLKEKKFLKDSEQEPAIRVALRAIKDFAVPFKSDSNEIYWRYFTISEEEFEKKEADKNIQMPAEPKKIFANENAEQKPPLQKYKEEPEPKKEKLLEIFDKEKTEKKTPRKKQTPKVNEKFFNKVKEYLSENQTEISDIINFSKSDIFLKVKSNEREHLLISYNKKTIREDDIIKAYKKAQELNLPFEIISLGEPTKKLLNFIEAIRNLKEIKKIN